MEYVLLDFPPFRAGIIRNPTAADGIDSQLDPTVRAAEITDLLRHDQLM